jgi:uncharacterized protein with FMN-binding domain
MLRSTAAALLALLVQNSPDEIELLNGQKFRGKLIEETQDGFTLEIPIGNAGSTRRKFASKDVHVLRVGKEKRVINEKNGSGKTPSPKKSDPSPKSADKGRDEVEAAIRKLGPAPPDWYAQTALNYPKTLDLNWPEPPPTKGWDTQKNVGQFIWSVINENPSRWKEGVRFMHHLLTVHKDNPKVLRRVLAGLGRMYHDFFEDWARAAYWFRKALAVPRDDPATPNDDNLKLDLADCYLKLGSKEMALEITDKYSGEFTRHGSLIKLLSEMGDLDKALKYAEDFARGGYPDVGYLCAGDACRLAGKFSEAIDYYQKAIDSPNGGRDIPKNKGRAKASQEAIRLFETLDVKKIAPGKYRSSSIGYEAPVEVEVTVASGKIVDVRVVSHKEKQFYSSLTDTPRRIIEKNTVKGVDVTTGATLTSEAIINATAKALAGAMPKR